MRSSWGHSPLTCPKKLSIGAWSVGVCGRPKCWTIEHHAKNSRVDPEVIWGPLSDTASSSGRVGSSRARSTRPSWRAATSSSRPSAPSAAPNTTSTWVEVSSALSRVASHLRLTRSMIANAQGAARQRPKWVTSQPHTWLGRYSSQSGQGCRCTGARPGGLGSTRSWATSTLKTLAGETHTRPSREPRWASLRWERSTSSHCSAISRIASTSSTSMPWTAPPPAGRSASVPAARRACQRLTRRSPTCSTRQAACTDNPSATAWSTSPSSACLVAAATRGGHRRSTPTRFSPQQGQLDRLLLDRLAQPLYLRPGRGQLGVLAGLAHPRLGRRQRLQRTLLGDLTDAHDRRAVDPEPVGRLALAQLAGHQLQPPLVLLARAQEPLGAAPKPVASGVLLGHLHPPARGRRTLPDAVKSEPGCRTRSQTQDKPVPLGLARG